jgi:hypothetical protein
MGMEDEAKKGKETGQAESEFIKNIKNIENSLGVVLEDEQRHVLEDLRNSALEYSSSSDDLEKDWILQAVQEDDLVPTQHQAAIAEFIFNNIQAELKKKKAGKDKTKSKKGKAESNKDEAARRKEEFERVRNGRGKEIYEQATQELGLTKADLDFISTGILDENQAKYFAEKILGSAPDLKKRDKTTKKFLNEEIRKKYRLWHPDNNILKKDWTAEKAVLGESKGQILSNFQQALKRSEFFD